MPDPVRQRLVSPTNHPPFHLNRHDRRLNHHRGYHPVDNAAAIPTTTNNTNNDITTSPVTFPTTSIVTAATAASTTTTLCSG